MSPTRADQSAGPLDGVRVIDFSRVIAGPYAARILTEMAEAREEDILLPNSYQKSTGNSMRSLNP